MQRAGRPDPGQATSSRPTDRRRAARSRARTCGGSPALGREAGDGLLGKDYIQRNKLYLVVLILNLSKFDYDFFGRTMNGGTTKKMHVFGKGMLDTLDDVFWMLPFSSKKQASLEMISGDHSAGEQYAG